MLFRSINLTAYDINEITDNIDNSKITYIEPYTITSDYTNVLRKSIIYYDDYLKNKYPNLLEKFICISTDEVSCDEKVFQNETMTHNFYHATNPYSSTKACAELIAKSFYQSFKLPVIITRSTNNYGKHQFSDKLIPKFLWHVYNKKKFPLHQLVRQNQNQNSMNRYLCYIFLLSLRVQ